MKCRWLLIFITDGNSDFPYFVATLISPMNTANQMIPPARIPAFPTQLSAHIRSAFLGSRGALLDLHRCPRAAHAAAEGATGAPPSSPQPAHLCTFVPDPPPAQESWPTLGSFQPVSVSLSL